MNNDLMSLFLIQSYRVAGTNLEFCSQAF